MSLNNAGTPCGEDFRKVVNWFDFQPPASQDIVKLRSVYTDRHQLTNLYDVRRFPDHGIFKMTVRGPENAEARFSVVGVVQSWQVPGMKEPKHGQRPTQCRSGLVLRGEESWAYEQAVKSTEVLFRLLSNRFHPSSFNLINCQLKEPKPEIPGELLRCRGYTLERRRLTNVHIPFTDKDDPHGSMRGLLASRNYLVRTRESIVDVFDARPASRVEDMPVQTYPSTIQKDDIVEAVVCPVVEHLVNRSYMVVLRLRKVTLLHRFEVTPQSRDALPETARCVNDSADTEVAT